MFLGATGDVGSIVVPRLQAAGHEVIAPPSTELDLTNPESVAGFFKSLDREYALIFAAFVDRRRAETVMEFEMNQQMVVNVTNYSRPSWCVFFSSIAVYGESPQLPINENSILAGEGLYAKAKQVAERQMAEVSDGEFPCLTVRFPGIFGGRAHRRQSFDVILKNGIESGEISLGGNGNVLRDWVSATEVTDFLMLNARNPRKGVVNFVRGESIAIDEYVAIALEELPNIRHHCATPGDASATSDFVFDGSRLQVEFPDWSFPPRERDIHKLARELKDLASRQIQL